MPKASPHILFAVLPAIARRPMNLSILAVFFFAGWWLRPDYQGWDGTLPYFLGFLVTLPALLAIALWFVRGMPGLIAALSDERRWWLLALAGLTFWAALSPQWSRFQWQTYSASGQFLLVAVFTLVLTCVGPSARSITFALALGLIWQSVIVIVQFTIQQSVGLVSLKEFILAPGRYGISVVAAGSDLLIRPYGLMAHPNMIGGYLVVGLLALTGWFASCTNGLARWRWAVRGTVWALGVWALCLTFSRGAWAGFATGLILIGLSWLRPAMRRAGLLFVTRRRITGVLLITAMVGVAFGVGYPRYLLARAATGNHVTELRSVVDRRVFIEIALMMIQQYPLAGVGIGASAWEAAQIMPNTPYRELRAQSVHNLPLLILSELGIIGLALWGAAMIWGARLAWRRTVDPYAVGLAAGAAALLAIGMVDHYPWSIMHFALLLWGGMAAAIRSSAECVSTGREPACDDLHKVNFEAQ